MPDTSTTSTTANGTVTSFSNTPQATSDLFLASQTGLTEDNTTTSTLVILNVMANDLGGTAKTLWSLDNSISASTATKLYAPVDLLAQDTARTESLSSDYSLNGAHIWITSSGMVAYDASTFSASFVAQLQQLQAGQFAYDTFTYAIRLGNGTLSWATATVQIAGLNDAPFLAHVAPMSTINEALDASAQNIGPISGTLQVSELDAGDTLTASIVGSPSLSLSGGTLSVAQVSSLAAELATGRLSFPTSVLSNGNPVGIGYVYTPSAANLDFLADGQTLTVTYIVRVSNGTTSTATQPLTITITGTNDAPVVTADAVTSHAISEQTATLGASTPDAASGTLAFSDVDLTDTHTVTNALATTTWSGGSTLPSGLTSVLASALTTSVTDSTGSGSGSVHFGFSAADSNFDFLAAGQTLTVTYNVTVKDSSNATSTQPVTFTITGTNDAPVVGGAVTGGATEDGVTRTLDALANASDVDDGTTLSVVNVPGSLPAGLTYNSGTHSFTLDPGNAAYQHLAQGQTTDVTVSYGVSDGTATTAASVTFTVTGTNDAPVVSSAVTGSATEDGATKTLDALANASDVDDGTTLSVVNVPAAASLPAGVSYDAATHSFTLDPSNAAYQHLAQGQTTDVVVNYGVSDGTATTGASVTFTVTGTNDAPVVSGAVTGGATEDGVTKTLDALVNASDVDDGTTLSVVNVPGSLPAGASYDAATHSFTLDPSNAAYQHLAQGQTTDVTVGYGVSDGTATTAASVTFTVIGTNDAPVVSGAVTGGATEDGVTRTLDALAKASDVDDSTTLSVVNVPAAASLPAGVSYDAATHSFTLDPSNAAYQHLAQGQTADVSVSYGVSDGTATTSASVTFTVTGTNDAPVVSGAVTGDATEDGATKTLDALVNASDVDDGTTLSVVNVPAAASLPAGVSYDAATHSFMLDPSNAAYQHLAAGATTDVVVSYGVSDGTATTAASVTFTVTGTNDAPVVSGAVTGNATEDGVTRTLDALVNASDVDDGTILSVVSVPGSLPAGVTYNSGTHSFTLDPSNAAYQHLAQGQTANVTVSYGVSDGTATTGASVTFTVTGTNDAPVVTADAVTSHAISEQTAMLGASTPDAASGTLAFSDVDLTDTHTVTNALATTTWSGGSTLPSGLTSVLASALTTSLADSTGSGSGSVHFGFSAADSNFDFLAAGQTLTVTYNVTVKDGSNATSTQPVTFTITGTNDAPTIDLDANNSSGVSGVNYQTTFTDSGSAIAIADVDATISDPDNAQMSSAVVTLTNAKAGDSLSVSGPLPAGITGTVNSGTAGVITVTLSGLASNADYQNALHQIVFSTIANPDTTDRNITVTVNDGFANSNTANSTIHVHDATTPTGGTPDLLAASDSGASSTDNLTNVSSPSFSVALGATVAAGDVVKLLLGGSALAHPVAHTITATDLLNQSVTLTVAAGDLGADGVKLIGATFSDASGNTSTTAALSVTLDTTAPNDSISATIGTNTGSTTTIASGGLTKDNTLALSGTVGDANGVSSVHIFDGAADLGTATVSAGTWSFATAALADGSHSFTAKATDTAGNTTTTSAVTATVDSLAPTISAVGDNVPGTAKMGQAITFTTTFSEAVTGVGASSFTATNGTVASVTQVDSSHYTVIVNPAADVNSGNVALSLVAGGAVDAAGNLAAAASLASFDSQPIDTLAPTVTNVSFTKQNNDRTVTVTFSEAVVGFDKNDVQVSSGTVGTVTGSGTTWTVPVTNVNGSTVNFQVLASGTGAALWTDLAGNGGTASTITNIHPAGIAGEPINLALVNPSADPTAVIDVGIANVPSDWTISGATKNTDGSWTAHTSDPASLTVTPATGFVGALVLNVTQTWTNPDGSTGSAFIFNNVEAYAPGSPIFAVSADDHLTASSAADLLVFAQPIAHDVVHNFDAAADKIDLIGFTGASGFDNLSITDDASGNAIVTLGTGSTITVLGVHAADLGAANFVFNVEPVTSNIGTMTIANGAILPLGGTVENSGTIALGSTGSETDLQILVESVTLRGGGNVVLSDDSNNVIFGDASATLINVDNTISGAGQIGAGQMTLVNSGTIVADGSHALVIDTGGNVVDNSGTLEATGTGGLVVDSGVMNTGSLWANGGAVVIQGDVSGHGNATISGSGAIEFGGGSDSNVGFVSGASGTLTFDHAAGFTGTLAGLNADDTLHFGDISFSAATHVSYTANAAGTAGSLVVSDGVHTAQMTLIGQYSTADFQLLADKDGSAAITNTATDNATILGNPGASALAGTEGNDILVAGQGSQTLTGGGGNDTFLFRSDNAGAIDTITDFNAGPSGDMLNIGALLHGYTAGADLSQFIGLRESGSSTIVSIDSDGSSTHGFHDLLVLQGVTGLDFATLIAHVDANPLP